MSANSRPPRSSYWLEILAVVGTSISAIGLGIQAFWSSPSIPKLLSGDLGFKFTEDEISYAVMASPVGSILGSILSGLLADKIGRKYTLIVAQIPYVCGTILTATCTLIPILYLSRFLTGIHDGIVSMVLPMYIGETVRPNIRGLALGGTPIGLTIGGMIINVYGSFVSIRVAAWGTLLVPVLFLSIFIWMPKSPYYLLMKGRLNESRKSLRSLRRTKNVEEELTSIAAGVKRQMSEPGTFKDIFKIKSNLKAFYILIILRTVQQFSGFVGYSLYMQYIFQKLPIGLPPTYATIICIGVKIPTSIFGSVLSDKYGRRWTILFSCFGVCLGLFTLALYRFLEIEQGYKLSSFLWIPMIATFTYHITVSLGVVPVPMVMLGELASAKVKTKVLGIMNIYHGLGSTVFSKFFHWLTFSYDIYVTFFVFGILCSVGIVFIKLFVPETKGKTLEEIQQMLKGDVKTVKEEVELTEKQSCDIKN